MKRIFFIGLAVVAFAATAFAQECVYPTDTVRINFKRKIPGLLENGEFSVSATKKVHFAGGNLQYTKSTGKWKIMDHQYDMVETDGQNVGTDYASPDVITLFGWGTAGNSEATGAYQPYATSTTNTEYVKYLTDAGEWTASKSDWGVVNSGDLGAGWRTLTKDEWVYLLSSRTNASSLRKWSIVNSVPGLIIMPDGWSGTIAGPYSLDAWTTLEGQGAVFLPAAGYRSGTSVNSVGSLGRYWSSSAHDETYAHFMQLSSSNVNPQDYYHRYYGCSVRLVQDL